VDYNAGVAARTRLRTSLSLVDIVGHCLDAMSIFVPKAPANQAPPRGIKAEGSPTRVQLEGAVGSAAANMVTPDLRGRAGGKLGSLVRAAALGSEHGCC